MPVPLNDSPPALRHQYYNATVADIRMATEGLMILRVAYDAERPYVIPGQYLVLGLGNWEPRVDRILAVEPDRLPKLVRRAYSVSCPLFARDQIIGVNDGHFQEFCIRLVHRTSDRPAMLTPRLFCLKPGDRLYIGERPHGTYTLKSVEKSDTVLLLASGTGEAPHNAMIAELLSRGHTGQIVCTTCVRHEVDLAYISAHRQLEKRFSNYHYVPLTTREVFNLDRSHPRYRGRMYLQDWADRRINSRAVRRVGSRQDPRLPLWQPGNDRSAFARPNRRIRLPRTRRHGGVTHRPRLRVRFVRTHGKHTHGEILVTGFACKNTKRKTRTNGLDITGTHCDCV